MTETIYPPSLIAQLRALSLPVFSMEIAPPSPDDCANCGGIGHVFVFVAERGPFRDVPGGLSRTDSILKSATDEMYGWVWYVGRNVGAECSVCKGMGSTPARPAPLHQFNTVQPVHQLAERFQK